MSLSLWRGWYDQLRPQPGLDCEIEQSLSFRVMLYHQVRLVHVPLGVVELCQKRSQFGSVLRGGVLKKDNSRPS